MVHRVRIFSPGSFFTEQNVFEIPEWNVDQAIELSRTVVQRHGASPLGFRFETDDGGTIMKSGMYYLGGRVRTYDEVVADNLPDEKTLRWNMRINGYKRVIENTNSYNSVWPLEEGDSVLDVNF